MQAHFVMLPARVALPFDLRHSEHDTTALCYVCEEWAAYDRWVACCRAKFRAVPRDGHPILYDYAEPGA